MMNLMKKKGAAQNKEKQEDKMDVKNELFQLLKESKELTDRDRLSAYCMLFLASKVDKMARAVENAVSE